MPFVSSARSLFLLAAASGILLYASFFPVNLGFLGWIALVLMLHLVHSTVRSRVVYLAAFTGGMVFYVPALQWMRVAHPAMYGTWAFLALMSSAYMAFSIFLVRLLDRRRMPLYLSAPAVFVGLDYFRASFPTGFTWLEPLGIQHRIGFNWYFLGYTQHDNSLVLQMASLGGVYLVSFLVVMVNATLYLWFRRLQTGVGRRPWPAVGVTASLLIAGLLIGRGDQGSSNEPAGPRVALLQSNLPQAVKMAESQAVDQQMGNLLRQAIDVPADQFPDLIVWPETTCSGDWSEASADVNPSLLNDEWRARLMFSSRLSKGIGAWKANQLLGLNAMIMESDGRQWKYNSAKLINKDGTPGPRYDKMHLVPFGEYVPLESVFPWMSAFTPYTHDYSCKPGENFTRFPLKVNGVDYTFGCIICYESSDSSLARRYAVRDEEGGPVDFIVNISNDGWFNGTEEHEQHLAICRFRAVECRRSIVRAVNMGISCIIGPDGEILQLPGETWADSVKVTAVVNGVVPIHKGESLYPKLGDWVPLVCLLIVVIGLLSPLVFRCCRTEPS